MTAKYDRVDGTHRLCRPPPHFFLRQFFVTLHVTHQSQTCRKIGTGGTKIGTGGTKIGTGGTKIGTGGTKNRDRSRKTHCKLSRLISVKTGTGSEEFSGGAWNEFSLIA